MPASLVDVRIHLLPGDHWVDDAAWSEIQDVAAGAEAAVRQLLPTLAPDLYLVVHQTTLVLPETGDGGFTIGPHVIRWDVDPARDIERVARRHLRRTLFHECHHAVRLQRRPEDSRIVDWRAVAVFEGLATAFELEAGGERLDHQRYDESVMSSWAEELFRQPVDDAWMHWKFEHPDGRRHLAYKVGTWLADRAIDRSGRSAADLVWSPPDEIIELAAAFRQERAK